MYKIYIILTTFYILCFLGSFSQTSINTNGGNINTLLGSISYSIGEFMYPDITGKSNMSIGIQYNNIIHPLNTKSKINVSIYPNPTIDIINFKVQDLNFQDLKYSLFNSSGFELERGLITDESIQISLKKYPAGIYIIKFYRLMNEIQSHQIIKVN